MRISSSLATKISGYSILASALISAKWSEAQIIHVAINESLTPLGERTLPIDLNGDGKVDVVMALNERRSRPYIIRDNFFAIPENGASLVYTAAYNGGVAALGSHFAVEDQLPSSKRWDISNFMGYHYESTLGFFSYIGGPWGDENRVQRYVGIRINKEGQYYYGWIRCKLNLKGNPVIDRMTIIDFELNNEPDRTIYTSTRSGDAGLNKNDLESTNQGVVYATGKTLHIHVSDNEKDGANLSIYNICGEKLYSETISTLNQKIDLMDLPAGLYIAILENFAQRKSYKIVLQ